MSDYIYGRFYRTHPQEGWRNKPLMQADMKFMKKSLQNNLVERFQFGIERKRGEVIKPPLRADLITHKGEVLYSLMTRYDELVELPLVGEGAGTVIRKIE